MQPEGDADLLATVSPFGLKLDDGQTAVRPEPEFRTLQQDLEGLLLLGYMTDSFTLYGHSFTIRTLRRGEKLAVAQIIADYVDTIGVADAVSAATAAACIQLVDDRPLTIPLSPGEQNSPDVWIRRAFAVVKQWYDPVVDGIWDKYGALLARQELAFKELEGKS